MAISTSLILLAGGKGLRFNSPLPKQFHPLHGKALALHSYDILSEIPWIDEMIVVCAPEHRSYFPPGHFALPGERRQDSLYNGLALSRGEWILVHDAARPFLLKEELQALQEAAWTYGAATLATPVKATIKEATSEGLVSKTLPRSALWEIQTPQMIKRSLLEEGFAFAEKHALTVTDDVSLVESLGYPVKLVAGTPSNIKVTTAADLAVMKELLCPATA